MRKKGVWTPPPSCSRLLFHTTQKSDSTARTVAWRDNDKRREERRGSGGREEGGEERWEEGESTTVWEHGIL